MGRKNCGFSHTLPQKIHSKKGYQHGIYTGVICACHCSGGIRKLAENQGNGRDQQRRLLPCDSVNNELKTWVSTAREACGENMRIAIKADKSTSYAVIKRVMDSLREIEENRYNLITSLKGVED